MFPRQVLAARSRSGLLIVNCTSFSASANVVVETSGPAGGDVPNAGGAPGGGSAADFSGLPPRHPAAAASRPSVDCVRKLRRDLAMGTSGVSGSDEWLLASRPVTGVR